MPMTARREALAALLGVPHGAHRPLLDFERGGRPSRRFLASRRQVVFPFQCYLDEPEGEDEAPILRSIEVNVLVHGDYLLTVHREPVSLPAMLPSYNAEGRSEQYIVYSVLDGDDRRRQPHPPPPLSLGRRPPRLELAGL